MKRLIVNEPGLFVGVKNGLVTVWKRGEKVAEVPPPHVGQVAVFTRGASLSSALFRLLARHRIDLVVYSGYGLPVARLSSVRASGAVKLRKAQYKAQGEETGATIAKMVVLAKLMNQATILREAAKSRMSSDPEKSRTLTSMVEEIRRVVQLVAKVNGRSAEDVRGELIRLEADAAETYWRGFKLLLPEDVEFPGRRKRYEAPSDPANISINFCYGLLAAEVLLAVERCGLDPFAGFLHADSPRRPALVMDIMEEFRQPVADRVVLAFLSSVDKAASLVEGGKLKRQARFELAKAFSERLSKVVTFAGRALPISSHVLLQPRRLAAFLLGKAPRYAPFTTR